MVFLIAMTDIQGIDYYTCISKMLETRPSTEVRSHYCSSLGSEQTLSECRHVEEHTRAAEGLLPGLTWLPVLVLEYFVLS